MKYIIRHILYAFTCIGLAALLSSCDVTGEIRLPGDTGSEPGEEVVIESGTETSFELGTIEVDYEKTSDGEITFEFDCDALEDAQRIEGSVRNLATGETVASNWAYDDS